ncbi:hypothetical protein LU293_00235 [Moraxella nasovis]|uniref:hypothetical protein n=1 Tax=Moraxella nasovis TaxID=2904121 RepID=UPI001F61245C|nr:hypothetical protein [Moraxella nasovis]UNU73381.1 hypothetical protein LU293_00235 [Moraxella nasovis]
MNLKKNESYQNQGKKIEKVFNSTLLHFADLIVTQLQSYPMTRVKYNGQIDIDAVKSWALKSKNIHIRLSEYMDIERFNACAEEQQACAEKVSLTLRLEQVKNIGDKNSSQWYEEFIMLMSSLDPVYQLWVFCDFCQRAQTFQDHLFLRGFFVHLMSVLMASPNPNLQSQVDIIPIRLIQEF